MNKDCRDPLSRARRPDPRRLIARTSASTTTNATKRHTPRAFAENHRVSRASRRRSASKRRRSTTTERQRSSPFLGALNMSYVCRIMARYRIRPVQFLTARRDFFSGLIRQMYFHKDRCIQFILNRDLISSIIIFYIFKKKFMN